MRIWILSSELADEVAGGIARYVDNFGRLLAAAGHQVVLIAKSHQALDQQVTPGFRLIGVEPRDRHDPNLGSPGELDQHPAYPYNVLPSWPAFSYQMAEEVLKLLGQLPPPDIIESQDYAALPYFLIQRKLTERTILEQIPILVHLHSPDFELARSNQEPRFQFPDYWIGQMVKFCVRGADALLSPSDFLVRKIKEAIPVPLEIDTIAHPCLLAGSTPGAQVQPGHIVYVGRLQVCKGILPLLKACDGLWAAGQDFRLTLIGADCSFPPMDTMVSAFMERRYGRWLQSGHLTWLGQLEHAAVLEHLERAWAVVIPSLWENFPNTCMEAMAAGQVVLGSTSGGQAEMIEADGVNGFLFDWQIPGDFERKLTQVLHLNPAERLEMGRRAQARLGSLCDPQTVLRQRVAHFQKIIERYEPKRYFPAITGGTPGPVQVSKDEQAGLLSALIPYYNLGEYLPDTLESVLASSYSPLEVIIINDGSTDPKSLEALRAIEDRKIPDVRILHTENQGLPATRNYGAQQARGEFIAFVDADDMVEPDFFPRSVDLLQRYPNVAFVYSWIRDVGDSARIWPTWNAEFPYLLGRNMSPALVVIRRAAFLHGGQNKQVFEYNFEDYEGWISVLAAGGLGVSLPLPLVRYRVRADSMFRAASRNQQLYLYDLLTQHHPDLYREWGVELFNLIVTNGPGLGWDGPTFDPTQLWHQKYQDLYHESLRIWEEAQMWYQKYQESQTHLLAITNSLGWRICQGLRYSPPGRLAAHIIKRAGVNKDKLEVPPE